MKKIYFVLLFQCFWSIFASSKTLLDTLRLHHKKYSVLYDKAKRYPLVVHWELQRGDIECAETIKRKNKFSPDFLLFNETDNNSFYKKSGYDRGHNMPAADCQCDVEAMEESFYFSNISPQTPQLNRKLWNELEQRTRYLTKKYGYVSVYCGCVGEKEHIGALSVPDKCWKVIFFQDSIKSYVFPNSKTVDLFPYTVYETKIDSIYQIAPYVKNQILNERTPQSH